MDPPPLQIYPLLDHFPEQFLKFLTKQAKSKLFGEKLKYAVAVKISNLLGKLLKREKLLI